MFDQFFSTYRSLLLICTLAALNGFAAIYSVMSSGRLAVEQGAGAWSTLPMGVQYSAIMIGAIPVSKILMKYGIRQGLLITQSLCVVGGLICLLSVIYLSFLLLLVGVFFIGFSLAGLHQMRFIATETVDVHQKPIALSAIVAMQIVAALLAAPSSSLLIDSFGDGSVLDSYIWVYVSMLSFVSLAVILLLICDLPTKTSKVKDTKIDFSLLKKEGVKPAIFIASMGYGAMTFLMTATPLIMQKADFVLQKSNQAVGYHVLGMSIPSLLIGWVITQLGYRFVSWIGVFLYLGVVWVNLLAGYSYGKLVLSLVLLGMGWSALYIAGSTALTKALTSEERQKIQGVNDLFVFLSSGIAGFGAGIALYHTDWVGTNIILCFITLSILIASFRLKK